MSILVLGVLVMVAPGPANAQSPAPTATAVLASNHTAMGAVPASGTIFADYIYTAAGMTGRRSSTIDLATGDFVDSDTAGPISLGFGYDGMVPWMRDLSGANTSQQGGDRIETTVNEAYRRANLWWRSDLGGARIVYAGREQTDGGLADHLIVTPKGGKAFDAWFDAGSHVLLRIAEPRQFFKTQTFYADYTPEGAFMLPHSITFDPGVGKDHYETLKLEHSRVGPASPVETYARPVAPPEGMTIAGGKTGVRIPFRLLNNHVYVTGTVNGKGPYTFIVDTGGHTLLSPRVVAEAGLDAAGKAAVSGTGDKVETSGFVKVAAIDIGGVQMHDQTAIVTNVYDTAIEGIPVDGMLGFELFRRFVVQLDYGASVMTVTDFAAFDPKGAGTAIPFVFYDHLPFVAGKIGDRPARFDIDTGSRTELDLTSPFVAREKLRDAYAAGVSNIDGWGTGGPTRSYMVRLPSVTLGSVPADNVIVGLSEAKGGSLSDPSFEGNVGGGLLKRFVVTFDYQRQVMYLRPLEPPPGDAGTFDRSGLWINAEDGGYRVAAVAAGSPAAQAGLMEGDVIVAIDGKAAQTDQLSDTRVLLRMRPAGTKLSITFRRGGKEQAAVLTLRDQI